MPRRFAPRHSRSVARRRIVAGLAFGGTGQGTFDDRIGSDDQRGPRAARRSTQYSALTVCRSHVACDRTVVHVAFDP